MIIASITFIVVTCVIIAALVSLRRSDRKGFEARISNTIQAWQNYLSREHKSWAERLDALGKKNEDLVRQSAMAIEIERNRAEEFRKIAFSTKNAAKVLADASKAKRIASVAVDAWSGVQAKPGTLTSACAERAKDKTEPVSYEVDGKPVTTTRRDMLVTAAATGLRADLAAR